MIFRTKSEASGSIRPADCPLPAVLRVPSDVPAPSEDAFHAPSEAGLFARSAHATASSVEFDPLSVPHWKSPGARVRAGEPLALSVPELHMMPLAPTDGIVGNPLVARLLGGKSVHAVELHVEAVSYEEHPATLAAAETGPSWEQGVASKDSSSLTRAVKASPLEAADLLLRQVTAADLGTWLTRLAEAGVSAERATCPALLAQLGQMLRRPVDTLLCSFLDTDPWLALNRVAAVEHSIEIAAGIGLIQRLTAIRSAWALVDQAELALDWTTLRTALERLAPQARFAPIDNTYPQFDPTLLIHASTGRRLRPGRLPPELGVVMMDAAAAASIGRVVLRHAADDTETHSTADAGRTPLVIFDQPAERVFSLRAWVGSSVGDLLQWLQVPAAVRELYAGSPLRQTRAATDDVIGPGELTVFAGPFQPPQLADPCIRCGWCIESCPTRCRPLGLLEAAQDDDVAAAERNGLHACIECGLCDYLCPSQLPILSGIRRLRGEPSAATGRR